MNYNVLKFLSILFLLGSLGAPLHASNSKRERSDEDDQRTQQLSPLKLVKAEDTFEDGGLNRIAIAILDATEALHIDRSNELPARAELLSQEFNERYSCRYLTTPEEHQEHLLKSIRNAKHSIMITSWDFTARPDNHGELFKALKQAALRKVKIYLYFHGGRNAEFSDADAGNIQQRKSNFHSKILMVDDNELAVGSYDWLQNPALWKNSANESIFLDLKQLKPFKERIWYITRSYMALSFNQRDVQDFDNRFKDIKPECIRLSPTSDVELVTTPQRHRGLFLDLFAKAQQRLVLCVFSITAYPRLLQEFIPYKMVGKFLKAGKRLEIIYNPWFTNVNALRHHLRSFLANPKLIFTPKEHLHQKTLIADDNFYMCGSYNLLSSADTLLDHYSYMETSVVFTGYAAQLLTKQFEAKFLK